MRERKESAAPPKIHLSGDYRPPELGRMSYAMTDVEVTREIADLPLPDGTTGVAIVVRRNTRPVGFVMEPLSNCRLLTAARLKVLIARHCASKLVQESIREELSAPVPGRAAPAVSLAICTKDRPELLKRLLESMRHLRPHNGAQPFEVLIVDNAPSDESTRVVCAGFPDVRYVREAKAGLNFARNRAIRCASGDFLAFLDDDVVVDRWWLEGLYEALAENPTAAAVTGLVLPYKLETPSQVLFEAQGGFRRGFDKLRYHQGSMPDDPMYPCGAGTFGAGCNMVLRRDVLLSLGGFDEALDTGAPLPGGGDLDIFYRVVRSGELLVYEPRMLVFHEHRRELPKLQRQYWTWGLGFMAYVDKTYRSDPAYRPQLRRMVRWWFSDQVGQLWLGLRGRHPLPPRLIAAEFLGGLAGLSGTYSRSRRRTQQIRMNHS
jgi:GT2 family glycosyltransferase